MRATFIPIAICSLLTAATTTAGAQDRASEPAQLDNQQSGALQSDSRSLQNLPGIGLGDLLRDNRVAIGLRISPVELNFRGKNRALVGLGSYLVNATGGCNDCHTHPSFVEGGNPFKGETEIINAAQYLSGGRAFGPIVSRNITPDADGRPAGLTFEEFESTLRTGREPDEPDHILQVMPWNVYGKMTTLDLRAIYEFLRAIPSLPNNPQPGP
jgi:hypothetical protein